MQADLLISRIYESAALPETWPTVLQDIASEIASVGCTLIAGVESDFRWMASPAIHASVETYFSSGWAKRNDRILLSQQRGLRGLMRDIDLFSKEEIEAMPVVREFLRPHGLGWGAGLVLPLPSGETILFSVEKAWDRGPVTDDAMTELERLRPHLSRAALLTAHLRFERAKAAVDAFGLTDVPAALLTRSGTLFACNSLFEQLAPQIVLGARGAVRIGNERQAALLQQGLAHITAVGHGRTPMSIAVPALADRPALVVHLIPANGKARDIFDPAAALVLVSRVAPRRPPPATLLIALFDLTPAESRVASELIAGRESAEIASMLGISGETLRNHVKAILAKSGTRRRIDFVRLIGGVMA